MDWRGRRVPGVGWYIAAFAVASGLAYGIVAGSVRGHDGIGGALIGAGVAVAWGALVFAAAPPFIAVLVTVASLFVGLLVFGADWPAATYAGVVANVAGWMLGVELRFLLVGRRRPPLDAPRPAAARGTKRGLRRLTGAQRRDMVIAGVAAAVLLALGAVWFLGMQHGAPVVWLLVLAQALAWSGPVGWWAVMRTGSHAEGGAPINAALWGILFNALASAGTGAYLVALLTGVAGLSLGAIASNLYDRRRPRR